VSRQQPEGTLIVGHRGKIHRSAFTDQPNYPAWNGECADAHIFEGSATNVYTFTRDGRDYRIDLIGFYGPTGALTQTFRACENNQSIGTVNLQIKDVTLPRMIPTLSELGLIATALLLAGAGGIVLRRNETGSGNG
jgi:hypothetical protein